jgi:hypothetical protein
MENFMTVIVNSACHDISPQGAVPEYLDRSELAKLLSKQLFPVSARTLRRWPLTVTFVNGRALHNVGEALAYAENLLATAPRYKQQGA